MVCKKCGRQIPDDGAFCPNCGEKAAHAKVIYTNAQPGASPHQGTQPGTAPYPDSHPDAPPYAYSHPGTAPYPNMQPGTQQPGASPYTNPYPGASPYPNAQQGYPPYGYAGGQYGTVQRRAKRKAGLIVGVIIGVLVIAGAGIFAAKMLLGKPYMKPIDLLYEAYNKNDLSLLEEAVSEFMFLGWNKEAVTDRIHDDSYTVLSEQHLKKSDEYYPYNFDSDDDITDAYRVTVTDNRYVSEDDTYVQEEVAFIVGKVRGKWKIYDLE